MDADLKSLQDKQKKLQANKTDLNNKKIQGKEAPALAFDIQKINAEMTQPSSDIQEIESGKEDIKNFLNGEKITDKANLKKYYSILESELTKVMEEKLTSYVKDNKDNTDIEKAYQSLDSRKGKIITLRNKQLFFICLSFLPLVSLAITLVVMCIIISGNNHALIDILLHKA